MTAARRWTLAVVVTVVLLGAPIAVRALPADDPAVPVAELLAAARASEPVAYSGYVESAGRLQLPVTDQFSEVAGLLGGRSRLRVWWRSADDWRVDSLTPTGETDLLHAGGMTTEWDYEGERVTTSPRSEIRLPRSSDLLPPELGRLVLADARPGEVSAIGPETVAGIDAAGLRLVPAERQATVDHVDVWIDPDTGLPLQVSVYSDDGAAAPDVSTRFLELSTTMPAEDVTRFDVPAGVSVDFDDVVDVAGAAQRYAPVVAPRRLAGLGPRRGGLGGGAVGEYGRGVTGMAAVPLWENAAEPLREQLAKTPGVVVEADGSYSLAVGPLGLLLTPEAFDEHSWLVLGTVTHATLARAGAQLPRRALLVADR
jgi:outer membrane lipoprotein-sorting protein